MKIPLFLFLAASLTTLPVLAQEPASARPSARPSPPLLPGGKWHVNDLQRPAPPVVTPGTFATAEASAKPPSDAVVLFDGTDNSQWVSSKDGGVCPWKVENGSMVSAASDIQTKENFGDVQVHVEYLEPTPATGSSQGRGNSGIYLMGLFEVQVLDDYNNPTYADGMAGAVYTQTPPMANACRPPEQWQVYEIAFTAPRLDDHRNVATPAFVTVFLNGVLVQNHTPILGPTVHARLTDYSGVHTAEGPLKLQYHHNSLKFRSVWLRKIIPAL